ncbi:MAG: SWIM zinc finger family protein [Desulfobacterales bacterium]
MGRYSNDYWRPYVPVAERRRQAAKKLAKLKKAGCEVAPVEIAGRKIALTFWGDAWCKNLEAYSDYSNRLPRGRTYVRNGSVIDLQIEAGRVRATVSGSEIYEVDIRIEPLARSRWAEIKNHCAGRIDSLVELLKGSISKGVMEIVTRKGQGLFPSPQEITLSCSCPDWATMCKHVAAALYGVGARLDHRPELLFALRGVDPTEMIEAAVDRPPAAGGARKGRVLESDELSSVFGIDIDMGEADPPAVPTAAKPARAGRRSAGVGNKAASKSNNKKAATKPAAKKTAAKKGMATKIAPKKTGAKKTPLKKTPARKPAKKKPPSRKSAARKANSTR